MNSARTRPCGKVSRRAAEGQCAADDAAAVVLQRGGGFLEVLVDLVRRQVQRTIRQPVLDLLDAGQGFGPEFAEAGEQLPAHQGQRAGDDAR